VSVQFEQLFVNCRAILIFDPGVISPVSLVRDDLKGDVRVVGFGFDDPSGHRGALRAKHDLKHPCSARTLIKVKTDAARRDCDEYREAA